MAPPLVIYYLKHMYPNKRSDHVQRATHLTSLSIVNFIPITNSIWKIWGSKVLHQRSVLRDFRVQSVKILVSSSPTHYMLWSFGFFFTNLRCNSCVPFKRWVTIPKSWWTSAGHFSNSTGPSISSGWFSSFMPEMPILNNNGMCAHSGSSHKSYNPFLGGSGLHFVRRSDTNFWLHTQ